MTKSANTSENNLPQSFNSWIIMSEDIFVKKMDKSTFQHEGTGVPKKIQKYWRVDHMKPRENMQIILQHNGKNYNATMRCDNLKRTRLIWQSDFRNIIHERYMELAIQYQNEEEVDTAPRMHFVRIGENKYIVNFVDVVEVENSRVKETSPQKVSYTEGRIYYIYSKKYERDPRIRKEAMDYHGYKCKVCGFEFEKKYGEIGQGYIEIHHLNPLYVNSEEVSVDIEKDLAPLCSNCHRMVHRKRNRVVAIDELKQMIQEWQT